MARYSKFPSDSQESAFAIHSLNNYTNFYLSSSVSALDLDSRNAGDLSRALHRDVARQRAQRGVEVV